jgi:predicted small secreted protein
MKRILLFAVLLGGAVVLPSCSMADGLMKTVSRTGNSLTRSVSNAAGAVTR